MPIHDWTRVDAGVFHDFHLSWLAAMKRALNKGGLPRGFYAMTEQVTGPGNPDVLALRRPTGAVGPADPEPAGLAVAEAPPRVRFQDRADEQSYARRTRSVVVRRTNGDAVVAVIELVSSGNKGSRPALNKFVTKSVDYLAADVHLLVLDLYPPTRRDPEGIHGAIWSEIVDRPFELPADKRLTLAAYVGGVPTEAFVEPVAVGDVFPDMPLFLSPDHYVPVPLERTYQEAWDETSDRWQDVLAPPPG